MLNKYRDRKQKGKKKDNFITNSCYRIEDLKLQRNNEIMFKNIRTLTDGSGLALSESTNKQAIENGRLSVERLKRYYNKVTCYNRKCRVQVRLSERQRARQTYRVRGRQRE